MTTIDIADNNWHCHICVLLFAFCIFDKGLLVFLLNYFIIVFVYIVGVIISKKNK